MSWFIVELTKEEQEIVHQERQLHPNLKIRERMNIIWYLHNQLTRKQAAALALVDRSSVERVMVMYRDGGLDGLRVWKVPVGWGEAHLSQIHVECLHNESSIAFHAQYNT